MMHPIASNFGSPGFIPPQALNPFGGSDDNEVPSKTSCWSNVLVDKIGIRKVKKSPFELVRDEWSLCCLDDKDTSRINDIAKICSLPCIDFNALDTIPFNNAKPFNEWMQEWFPKITVKELKSFNENCGEFGFFLYDIIQQINSSKRKENHPLKDIEYQFLFEKFLRLLEIKTKVKPYLPQAKATLFGKEISSTADILCLKCDDPRQSICVCQVNGKHTPVDDVEYSPARKKMCSSSTVCDESPANSSCSFDFLSDVYPQHLGQLLVHLDSSVVKKGLLGIVVEKTKVVFTFLKISPESYDKLRTRHKPGSVKFDPSKEEEPIFYYTEQYNYLNREDRETIFKTLLAVKLMDEALARSKS